MSKNMQVWTFFARKKARKPRLVLHTRTQADLEKVGRIMGEFLRAAEDATSPKWIKIGLKGMSFREHLGKTTCAKAITQGYVGQNIEFPDRWRMFCYEWPQESSGERQVIIVDNIALAREKRPKQRMPRGIYMIEHPFTEGAIDLSIKIRRKGEGRRIVIKIHNPDLALKIPLEPHRWHSQIQSSPAVPQIL